MNTRKNPLSLNLLLIKKHLLIILVLIFVGFSGFLIPQASSNGLLEKQEGFGESNDIGAAFNQGAGIEPDDPRVFVVKVINVFLSFLGIIFLVIIIYAGFKWMTAGGNEQGIEEAKKMMSAGIIGMAIILLAWAITNFVTEQIFQELLN